MRRPNPTLVLFAGTPLLFCLNMVCARWLSGDAPPAMLALGRWLIVALLLLPFLTVDGLRRLRTAARGWPLISLVILGGVFSIVPQYAAVHFTSATNVSLIFASVPLLVVLQERILLRATVGGRFYVGLATAFLGLCLVLSGGHPARLLAGSFGVGDLLALCAALSWAGYSFVLKYWRPTLGASELLFAVAAGGSICVLPMTVREWISGEFPAPGPRLAIGISFLALVAGLGAYLAWSALLRRIPSSRASMAMYLVPIYASIVGLIAFREPILPEQILAFFIIAGGVFISSTASISEANPTSEPQSIGSRVR